MRNRVLALVSLYDESQLKKLTEPSVASNTWKTHFFEALSSLEYDCYVLSTVDERAWPFGHIFTSLDQRRLPYSCRGEVIAASNFPYLRWLLKSLSLLFASLKKVFFDGYKPEILITYSCQTHRFHLDHYQVVALFFSRIFGFKWINIVADGLPPLGCKSHIALAWSVYESMADHLQMHYFEGGVKLHKVETDDVLDTSTLEPHTLLMYVGTMGPHGGVDDLITAVGSMDHKRFSLWLCGPIPNETLLARIKRHPHIEYVGFLSEEALKIKASQADIFMNPRNFNFKPNERNFPSKLLFYLGFAKPIISTRTAGMPEEYDHVLDFYSGDADSLRSKIVEVAALSELEKQQKSQELLAFARGKSWNAGIQRAMSAFLN